MPRDQRHGAARMAERTLLDVRDEEVARVLACQAPGALPPLPPPLPPPPPATVFGLPLTTWATLDPHALLCAIRALEAFQTFGGAPPTFVDMQEEGGVEEAV